VADGGVKLLDRSRSMMQAAATIGLATPVLAEVADYGALLFERLLLAKREDEVKDQRLALVCPYLMLIEMLDGVEVLLSSAACIPARLPLRTAFEAMLTIDFMLETDTQRRALAWVLCDIHRRIRLYETHDPKTDAGREFQRDYENDALARGPQPTVDSGQPVAKLRTMFALPQYVGIESEFQRLRSARRGRPPHWYNLFGGPRDLRGLAQRCNKAAQYGVLYRTWSGTAHADDLYRQIVRSKNPGLSLRVLRDPSELSTMAGLAISFFMDATRKLLEHYLPAELPAWRAWYVGRVQEPYSSLAAGRMTFKPEP
jgi:uncharacterized protein DUF5677